MGGYKPIFISGNETGLVQERQEFLLPNDAYPTLENMFIWREQIRRKQGCQLLGRLRRIFTAQSLGNASGGGTFSGNIISIFSLETNAQIQPGSVIVTDGTHTFTDNGLGVLVGTPSGSGTINYTTGAIAITGATGGAALTISFNYYPGLPVMGLRSEELNAINNERLIAFDQVYAYEFIAGSGWKEFIPGTTWSGNDSDFFWSTNYWHLNNNKLFWVTNFSGTSGDPIRYTDSSTWFPFAPTINAAGDVLAQCLCILPFRGRLVVFNTFEGANLATSVQFPQRIRWAAIGSPFPEATAWLDDIRGKGGFLDIPTAENIVSVGFVRDNLVIYCERSTWQLRYTGRSIAPFQIEKVNTELGAESTFSAIQFDTSLVGIGDKGIVECDSYKSQRIDIKIPDLVYLFNNDANGTKRVHGIRDIQQRLAYWTYPYKPDEQPTDVFPNRRLVYNYENDSWAIFKDSYTCFGTYQPQSGARWQDFVSRPEDEWESQDDPWVANQSLFPTLVGGNQQGYVEELGSNLNSQVANAVSLTIQGITGFSGTTDAATRITSVNHNLETNDFVRIEDIPAGTPYATSLNDVVFKIVRVDINNFDLYAYNPLTRDFTTPQLDVNAVYVGGGQISVTDNFRIISKKFNFIEQGQTIQLGFIDILMNITTNAAITLKVYLEYNNSEPINQLSQNEDPDTNLPDPFFNSDVPTSSPTGINTSKAWQRVYCPVRGSFITIEWTLSNEQMQNQSQESNVQIDAQILWVRPSGRQLNQVP